MSNSLPLEAALFLKQTWTSRLSGAVYENVLARRDERHLQKEPKLCLAMPQRW